MKKQPTPKQVALLALKLVKQQVDAEIKRVKLVPDDAATVLLCDAERQYTHLDRRADDSLGLRTRAKNTGSNFWRHEVDGATFPLILQQVGDNITRRAMK